jgi:hypothetical protein
MGWTNVLSIPGVTYQVEYKKFTSWMPWGSDDFGKPLTNDGVRFFADNVDMYVDWANFRIYVQIPGMTAPLSLRSVINTTSTSGYGDYFYSKGTDETPDDGRFYAQGNSSGISTGVLFDDSLPFLLYVGGYDIGALTGDFTIEVEAASPFWTGFRFAKETI